MKKLLTFLTLLTLFFGVGWADNAVFQFNSDNYSNTELLGTRSNGSITIVGAKGTNSQNEPLFYTNGNAMRFYSGNTLTISCSEGYKITGITFTSSTSTLDNFSTTTGSYSNGIWVGSANSIVFIISAAARLTQIVVTYSGGSQTETFTISGTGNVNGGTISATQTSGITSGTSVTLTATPDSGYELTAFTVGGTDVFDDMTGPDANGAYTYNITVTGNVTVGATFTEQSSSGGTAMIVFGDNGSDASTDVTSETLLDYTIIGASYVSSYSNINKVCKAISGVKFSSNKYDGELTINLSSAAQLPLSKIIVNAKKYGSDNASLSVDGTSTGSLTADFADYEITCNGTAKTSITLEATKRLYVKSITLVFVEEGDYTVTCAENLENGSISASPSTANATDPITITAIPDNGYELSTVTVTPESGDAFQATVSGNTATFNMPASSVNVTATFSLRTLNITRTVKTNGNVSDAGGWVGSWGSNCTVGTDWATNPSYSVTTTVGKEVTFVVGTNSNYQMLEGNVTAVDENGNPVALTSTWQPNSDGQISFSFTMPGGDVAITANFTDYRGTLRLAGHFNGNSTWRTGTAGPAFTYNSSNDTYTIKAYFTGIDDSGANDYFFLTLDGAEKHPKVTDGSNYYIYDLNGGSMPFNLSGGSGNNFGCAPGLFDIEINGALTSMKFTKVTPSISFNPAAGEIEGGTSISATSNIDTHITAVKAIDGDAVGEVTVGVNTDNGDTWNPSVTLNDGLGQTVYGKAWLSSNNNINATGSATYDVATHYAITCIANPNKGGTVKAKIGDDVVTEALAGETIKLEVAPKSGYEISSVTLNGTELTAVNGVYSFEMPAEAANVVANFSASTLHLTINNENSKGTVYGVPATSTVGSEISFEVTPKDGYAVNTVTYSFTPGQETNTTTLTAPYSFNMPGYDVTINITYTEQSSGGGDATDLYHESFGNNTGDARPWDDSYSVKTGVADVYSGINGYTVSNVKQGKNTTGSTLSGLNQSSSSEEASIIIGPLNVANYTDLVLSYQWKAGSIKGTYYTNLSYATSADGAYTEVNGTGDGATTFVERSYNLPEAAQVSTLYLKIIYSTSNTQAIIDEVNLAGVPNGVQAPVFTPAQGIYGIDVDVTISCPTSGATIYYTDDESDPKTSTTRKEYTGEILVSQSTTFKAYAVKDDLSSDVVTATYTINKNTEIETVTLDYLEPFTGSDGIGKFTIVNESGYSPVWSLDGNYGVKGTAYNPNTTPTNNAATSRLVSPIIDLTAATVPELTFSHQINSYFTDPSTQCTVWIRETTNGTSGTWVQLPVTVTVPASGSWSNDFARIDLSEYIDKKIQVSFLYTNPTEGTGAGTWEIQQFQVVDNSEVVVVNNIAEFMDNENVPQSTVAKFRNPVVVLYHYQQYYNDEHGDYQNDYIWVKDNSGYAIIYGHYLDVEYVNGDVIPAGFTATKNYYAVGKFYQLYDPEGLKPATEKALADPEAVTLEELKDNKNAYNGHYVTVSKMQIQFNKGKLVAWSTSSSGQRNFSVGDETLAIANNQSGTSSCEITGYNNFDNPWLETLDYPEYENTTTVYGDYNITGIFEQYNDNWEFMPIIITPWEAAKVTLHDLCDKGVEQNTYTISNPLQVVYIDGASVWVKDDTGQSIYKTAPATGDKNFAVDYPDNTRSEQAYYDQSNWCELKFASEDDIPLSFVQNQKPIIKGGMITGKFTNKMNPTLEELVIGENPILTESSSYDNNYYMAANFNGPQLGYFFMNPKPQEYADVVWAIYNSADNTMTMPSNASQNPDGFTGSFKVDMSMNLDPTLVLQDGTQTGKGYDHFHAIIRLASTATSNAPMLKDRMPANTEYVVYPLDITQDVPTGITDVNGKAVKSVKYVNVAGVVSDKPFSGVNIVVTEYTDGSCSTTKMLRK